MLDVLSFVAMRQQRIKDLVEQYVADGYEPPRLAIVIDDQNNAANASYIRSKTRFADACGIVCDVLTLTDETFDSVKAKMSQYDGIIVQYPFRNYFFDAFRSFVTDFVPARADVDGLRRDSRFHPCTPLGIMNYLDHLRDNGTITKDDIVVNVVGCGGLVGKPLVEMLIDTGYTPCVTRFSTPKAVAEQCHKMADVIVCATNQHNIIDRVYANKVYIDCGCNKVDGKLLGNVSRDCYNNEALITPVPGGVGRLTVLALFENVIEAYLDGILK